MTELTMELDTFLQIKSDSVTIARGQRSCKIRFGNRGGEREKPIWHNATVPSNGQAGNR